MKLIIMNFVKMLTSMMKELIFQKNMPNSSKIIKNQLLKFNILFITISLKELKIYWQKLEEKLKNRASELQNS